MLEAFHCVHRTLLFPFQLQLLFELLLCKMESKSSDKTKLPPIESTSKKGSTKTVDGKSPTNANASSKNKPAISKELSAAHPLLIGVDAQSLHPYYSELIDGLYKRPLVVSILIPKKTKKTFKYEYTKRESSQLGDFFSSDDEANQSVKRARTPERPSSRQAPKSAKKTKLLKVFIVKIYDLVESKEAAYTVVVRDFDKLLEELIIEENSMAVHDYFQPQSLEWWTRSLRHVLITFDKPNEGLSVVVDKNLIRKMVIYNMQHHVWMQQNLTPEQVRQQKIQRAASRKKRQRAQSRPKPLEDAPSLISVPWNDYVALGERNAGASFRGPSAGSGGSVGCISGKSSADSSSRKLPPVSSSSKTPPAQVFSVGDWIEANFKRGGQWFPGIVKKVHREPAGYLDIDYDDGRAEEMVEPKLVRAAGSAKNKKKKKRNLKQTDSLDLLSAGDGDTEGFGEQPSGVSAYPTDDPSSYDYGDVFSPAGTTAGGGYDSTYSQEESGYDVNASQSYGTDSQQWPENSHTIAQDSSTEVYENNSQECYDPSANSYTDSEAHVTGRQDAPTSAELPSNTNEEVLQESDYRAEDAGNGDYDSHAYDYTNQAVIEEDSQEATAAGAAISGGDQQEEKGYESEIAESAELLAREECISRPVTVSAYVEDLISNALEIVCPAPGPVEQAETAGLTESTTQRDYTSDEPPVLAASSVKIAATYDEHTADKAATQSEEVSDFIAKEYIDPSAQQSPTKMALQSLMQALSLEESSVEGSVSNKKAPKKVGKKKGSANTGKFSPPVESNASSLVLLGSSDSTRITTADSKAKKTKKTKVASKSSESARGSVDISRASAGFQPPRMEDYASPVIPRSVSPPSRAHSSISRKKKAKKPTTEKSTALVATADTHHPAVADPAVIAALLPPLKERVQHHPRARSHSHGQDDDDMSVGSHASHGSHFHGVDSHGNFDHSDLPHYNPHVTREEARKSAIQAILKPHSTAHDRYAYVMMPAPLHMSIPVSHHYGQGPKHEHPHAGQAHHDHNGKHAAHYEGDHHGSGNGEEAHKHAPHGEAHQNAPHHGHQQHHHHQHDPHYAHHDRPFEVSLNQDRTHAHNHYPNSEPDPLSETLHTLHYPTIFDVSLEDLEGSTSSLPPLPRQQLSTNTAATTQVSTAETESGTATSSSTALVVSDGGNRPTTKSKVRDTSPFPNKNQYKGPERRVIDIIEWARISVGGSPKKQKRKISAVEQRLLGR